MTLWSSTNAGLCSWWGARGRTLGNDALQRGNRTSVTRTKRSSKHNMFDAVTLATTEKLRMRKCTCRNGRKEKERKGEERQQDSACKHHPRLKIEEPQAGVVKSSRELNFSEGDCCSPRVLGLVASGR